MPFFVDEPPEQSNWTETNTDSLAFILNKPPLLKGEQGIDGEKGQKGEIGPRGIEGQKGEQGVDGSKGQKGEIGIGQKGEIGEKGIDGSKGQKGEEGLSITGEKGEPSLVKGQKGEKGAKGELGVDGEKGIQGQKGIQGEQGSKGQKGEIGNIGVTGQKGQKGEQGIIGNTGEKGQKGEIGLTGSKGQKGEVHSSKFVNNGSLNASDEIELVYDDGTNMSNKIDISALREIPTALNTYYGKVLKVVQPSSGSGTELQWHNQDTYSFSQNRTLAQLEVQKVIQDVTSPYLNNTTTNTYNFLPALVNDKVLSVANGGLTWVDFPADDNTRVTGFSIDSSHQLSLSQNDGTTPYSVNLNPYLDNKLPTTTTADKFAVSTTTANNWVISDKISLNPARLGENTPTTIHNESTLFGVYAGNGTSSANRITAFGYKACEGSGNGSTNTGIGYRALDGCSGVRNVGLGYLAGNGVSGNDNFALGEGSMDGGNNSGTVGIGRYAFRGANSTNCVGIGVNVMGSGFGFHTYATNSVQRSGSNKLLIGNNTSTAAWTTGGSNTGNPYLIDGTMGTNDAVRELKINANSIYFGSSLPTANSTQYKIWNDQGVLRYGSGSALAYTDTVFSLPPQANEPEGLLATNGSNVFWSAPSLSVQSTGATIGRSNTVAKSLSFESNVTTGVLGRINAFKGGNISSSIMFHGGTNSLYDTMEIRVQQGTSGSNPITAMYIGAQTAAEPLVSVFGDFRSILDCTIGKEDTLGTRKINFRTGTNTLNIAEINVFGRDNNATEAQYSQDEYKIGQNTTGSLYGYSRHLRKYNNVLLQMLRVGKDIQATDSYVEAFSSLKIVGAADHRLILGDFTAPSCAGRIDINFNNNTGLIGETNYRALDSNNAQALYGQTFCSLSTNNPIYGTYYIKVAQGGAIGTPYLARFGRTSSTANNEDIDFNGIVGIDTLRFSDATTMSTAPQIKNTLQASAPQNGTQIYNSWYHDQVRAVDVALINTKLDSSQVKNTLQSTALFAGTEVYNTWYHDTVRQLDAQVIATKLDSADVKNTLQSSATQNGTEIYNAWYLDQVRGVDVALINSKLNSTYVKNVLQQTALFAGLEVYNCWYHDTARQLDAQVVATKLNSSNVKNVLQQTALFAGLEVYNCWYHDTARQLDAQVVATKLNSSHVQTTYQATPNTDDIYDCSYVNNYLSTASVGYKNLSFKSSNTTTGLTMGVTDAYSGTDRLTAITHDIANSSTKSGKIEFFTFDNINTHGVVHKAMYLQDAKVYLNHLNASRSITLDSPSVTSNIINKCPGTPQFHIVSSNTSSGAIVLGDYKTFGQIQTTASVQYPPTLSANTSTILGITYTITSSSNAFVGSSYDRYKAFDRINNTGWHTDSRYNNGSGANQGNYQGSNSLGLVNGEWLMMEMSTALPFGTIKIIGRNSYDVQAPDQWEILASNNGTSWTSILQSTVHTTYNNGNGHTITINNTTAYTHYAMVIKAIGGNGSGGYCSLHEVQFFTVSTSISSEFTDIRTTKYSGNYGTLNLRVKQNGAMSNLITIGKQQASDTHDMIFEGDTSVNGILSSNDLRITGTGSKITFNSGQEQTDALTTPASNLNGYRLTANATGGWTWASPDVYYDATDRNINIGPINSNLGVDSISIGYYAGQIHSSRSREQSIFIGTRSGQNTIPETNATDAAKAFDNVVAIGFQSCQNSTFMENCVAIGSNAAGSVELNPHSNSNFIGSYAGHDSGSAATGASSYSNGFFGTNAGRNYVGVESQGFGRDCLYTYQKNTTQRSGNNAMGATSMRNNVGSFNCAQGSAALRWDSGGTVVLNHNVALGTDCMGRLTNTAVANSNDNCFIGSQSARILSGQAVGNVGIGKSSFYQGVGSKNVMLGFQSGYQHNGSNCIYIGENQGYQQTESNKLKIGTYQNQQIISGVMGSTSSASELQLNAGNVELARSDLPTAYDSANPNRIWVDGTGTGSNKSGVLRIGDVPFYCQVSGRDTSSFSNSFTTYIFPTVERDATSAYNTSTGTITLPSDGVYQITGTMRSLDGSTVGRQFGVGVHSTNVDGAHFLWHAVQNTTNGHDRTTYPYVRTGYFTQGTQLRMFVYVDGGAISMAMGGLSVYRLSD